MDFRDFGDFIRLWWPVSSQFSNQCCRIEQENPSCLHQAQQKEKHSYECLTVFRILLVVEVVYVQYDDAPKHTGCKVPGKLCGGIDLVGHSEVQTCD